MSMTVDSRSTVIDIVTVVTLKKNACATFFMTIYLKYIW